MLARKLQSGLCAVRDDLVAHARLSSLALLAEPVMTAQRDRAREAVVRIEQAVALQDVLARHFGARPAAVCWTSRDRVLVQRLCGRTEAAKLAPIEKALAGRLAAIASGVAALRQLCARSPLADAISLHLDGLAAVLPAADPSWPRHQPQPAPEVGVRSVRGPPHVQLDPIFSPAFSLLRDPDLLKIRAPHEVASFHWLAGLRESMAAELCSLSIVETDGLPLAFHRDFAKQAWDEMRHALFFVDVGVQLLPDFLKGAPKDHPLLRGAKRFAATGRGLPCPVEGNLYEVAFGCTLQQRLVLMHLDTETPGIARFKKELKTPFWRSRPKLAAGLELSTYDEASHARLGRTWLSHLLPDREERKAEVTRTRLLRGAFLIAAFSHHHRRPVSELLREVARSA